MKRVIFSIVVGVLFPVIYTIAVGTLCDFFPQYFSNTMYLFGRPAPGLIFAPIAVPFWIYGVIQYHDHLGLPFIFDTILFRVVFTLGFDILLYAMLTYAVLWYFGIFGRQTPPTSDALPPPGEF